MLGLIALLYRMKKKIGVLPKRALKPVAMRAKISKNFIMNVKYIILKFFKYSDEIIILVKRFCDKILDSNFNSNKNNKIT